jgi:hypothetical protein
LCERARAPGLRTGGVVFNRDETRMRAIYMLGRVERLDWDEVNVGVNVFNSIDGSSSFGCGLPSPSGRCVATASSSATRRSFR